MKLEGKKDKTTIISADNSGFHQTVQEQSRAALEVVFWLGRRIRAAMAGVLEQLARHCY